MSCWTFCAFELDTTSHLGAFASNIPSAQSLLALHSLVSLRSLLRGYMCQEVLPESQKNSFTPYLLSFSNQSESILPIALEQVFLLLDLCELLGARERGWCDQDGQGNNGGPLRVAAICLLIEISFHILIRRAAWVQSTLSLGPRAMPGRY